MVAFCMATKPSIARILQQHLQWEICFAEIFQSCWPTALPEHRACAWSIAIELCPKLPLIMFYLCTEKHTKCNHFCTWTALQTIWKCFSWVQLVCCKSYLKSFHDITRFLIDTWKITVITAEAVCVISRRAWDSFLERFNTS